MRWPPHENNQNTFPLAFPKLGRESRKSQSEASKTRASQSRARAKLPQSRGAFLRAFLLFWQLFWKRRAFERLELALFCSFCFSLVGGIFGNHFCLILAGSYGFWPPLFAAPQLLSSALPVGTLLRALHSAHCTLAQCNKTALNALTAVLQAHISGAHSSHSHGPSECESVLHCTPSLHCSAFCPVETVCLLWKTVSGRQSLPSALRALPLRHAAAQPPPTGRPSCALYRHSPLQAARLAARLATPARRLSRARSSSSSSNCPKRARKHNPPASATCSWWKNANFLLKLISRNTPAVNTSARKEHSASNNLRQQSRGSRPGAML